MPQPPHVGSRVFLSYSPDRKSRRIFFGERLRDLANVTAAFDAHALTLGCDLKNPATTIDIELSYDETLLPRTQLSWILDQFVHLIQWVVP